MEKNSGLGFMTVGLITTLLLTILKLTKVINWSWVWILSPIWIVVGLEFLAFVVLLFVVLKLGKKKQQEQAFEDYFEERFNDVDKT